MFTNKSREISKYNSSKKRKQQPHNKSYFVTACRPVSVLSKGEVSHPFFQTYTFTDGLKLGS